MSLLYLKDKRASLNLVPASVSVLGPLAPDIRLLCTAGFSKEEEPNLRNLSNGDSTVTRFDYPFRTFSLQFPVTLRLKQITGARFTQI